MIRVEREKSVGTITGHLGDLVSPDLRPGRDGDGSRQGQRATDGLAHRDLVAMSADTGSAATSPVVVFGATGAVGRPVVELLAARGHRVVAVSRHADQAQAVAEALPNTMGVGGSFTEPSSVGEDVPGVVVNCTGIEDVGAVERWRHAGWAVIDVTASSDYAMQLARARTGGPPLIVGVGLTPGLTSVLARDVVDRDRNATALTISCLVGLGEDYGDASRDWTYGRLGRRVDDPRGPFRNFSAPEAIEFPGGFGRRPAWRFDFADRCLLAEQLDMEVTTRYCFDSRLAGRTLALASAVPHAPEILRRLNRFSRGTVGGTAWWAGVAESDTGCRAIAIGRGQSFGTAAVAAIAADRLTRNNPSATRYLWDLVDVPDLVSELAPLGIMVHSDNAA